MSQNKSENNEFDLEALLTKVHSLEIMLLLTRTELKATQNELDQTRRELSRFIIKAEYLEEKHLMLSNHIKEEIWDKINNLYEVNEKNNQLRESIINHLKSLYEFNERNNQLNERNNQLRESIINHLKSLYNFSEQHGELIKKLANNINMLNL